MTLVRKMLNRDTIIEIRDVGAPDVVEMRYVSPHQSGWVKECYSLAVLVAAGWEPMKEVKCTTT